MSKKKKLLAKLLQCPRDFTWGELISLLGYFGFKEVKKGRTSGSRRYFKNKGGIPIMLHEPHPSKVLKVYAVKQIIDLLKKEGLI